MKQTIPSLLGEMTPEFKGHNLGAIVRMEPILIACELLKAIGDSGGTKESRVRKPQLQYERNANTSHLALSSFRTRSVGNTSSNKSWKLR